MFAQSFVTLIALSSMLVPSALAVPGAAWVRRQEDAQTSRTLDPAVISPGLAQDGQGATPDPGQVRSRTSTNNFINFCALFLDQGVPLTNGKQIATGSCNQTPMGRVISLDQAPRAKFVFPKNGDTSIVENTAFTVQMKVRFMQTGNFVNAQANYYSAPQTVNGQGILVGHSHVVIELLPDLQSTEPLNPNDFKFFKGLNGVAQNDILTATVDQGLPKGFYRICSINTASNHQPALVSNAQHGSLDDCSYFTIRGANEAANDNNNAEQSASVSESVSATATESVAESATESATATESGAEATQTAGGDNNNNNNGNNAGNGNNNGGDNTGANNGNNGDNTGADNGNNGDNTGANNGNNGNNGDNTGANNGNGGANDGANNGNGNAGQDQGADNGNNGADSGNNGADNGNNGNDNANNGGNDNGQNNGNGDNAQSSEAASSEAAASPTEAAASTTEAAEAQPTQEAGNNGADGNNNNNQGGNDNGNNDNAENQGQENQGGNGQGGNGNGDNQNQN